LHFISLILPLVNALPESPPKWQVSKCDYINVQEAYFCNIMISLCPVTSSKICHGCTNVDERMTHAGDNIGQEEVSESDKTKWSDCYIVERIEKFKPTNCLECLHTWLNTHQDKN